MESSAFFSGHAAVSQCALDCRALKTVPKLQESLMFALIKQSINSLAKP